MEKQSTLEEFLNDNRKLSLAESSNEDTKSINGSETIYSDKKRKRFGIYKTLMGSGLASGLGYMLANAYLAPGLASPALAFITVYAAPFILLGGYLVKGGLTDLGKEQSKKSNDYEIEKSE